MSPFCVVLAVLFLNREVLGSTSNPEQMYIWPLPQYVRNGDQTLYVSTDFKLRASSGSKYGDGSGILRDGFERMVGLLQQDHVLDSNFTSSHQSNLLSGIDVVIYSSNDEV